MKKALSVLLTLFLLCGALAGCGGAAASEAASEAASAPAEAAGTSVQPESQPESAAGTAEGAVDIVDMTGRAVVVPQPVEKIVALTAGDCEIVYALGAGDSVVGRGSYCDYPAAVLDVAEVASGAETNVEEILALEPDLVVMDMMAQSEDQINQISEAGVPVLVSMEAGIDGVYQNIGILGQALGREAEAEALVAELTAGFEALAAGVPAADEKPTVYFEVSPLEYGLWTSGADTFMDEIAALLGLENAFADVTGWAEISQEQVLERDPDYIVTTTMAYEGMDDPVDEILGREGWQGLAAVSGGHVFSVSSDEFTRPGPRLLDGAQALFNDVYGA